MVEAIYSGDLKFVLNVPDRYKGVFEPRSLLQFKHALVYEAFFADSGIPGHGQFMLLAQSAHAMDFQLEVYKKEMY